ncbi:MAG: hypothetical protein PHW74_10310 [Desulfobacca sp.]|nr:hypothetical protein [Desulfobacca sp.]
MEPQKIAKQMIDFYKASFDNTFTAMTMLQQQMEKMTGMLVEQSTWLPEEGRKVLQEWVKAYKKGREDFKAAADENFARVESFFAESETSAPIKAAANS